MFVNKCNMLTLSGTVHIHINVHVAYGKNKQGCAGGTRYVHVLHVLTFTFGFLVSSMTGADGLQQKTIVAIHFWASHDFCLSIYVYKFMVPEQYVNDTYSSTFIHYMTFAGTYTILMCLD